MSSFVFIHPPNLRLWPYLSPQSSLCYSPTTTFHSSIERYALSVPSKTQTATIPQLLSWATSHFNQESTQSSGPKESTCLPIMSCIMSKQLGDFLQEQQEPFILEVYLLERGYSSSNVGTSLKRSVSSGIKRNRKFIPNCSKIVRALFSRIVNVTNNQKISQSGIRDKTFSVSVIDSSRQETDNDDIFSSASSATIFNSCSESDGQDTNYSSRKDGKVAIADCFQAAKEEHILAENEVGADGRFRWENAKDSKQLSPVSVIEDKSAVASQLCRKHDARRTHKQFSSSVCAYKSENPFCTSSGDFARSDASSQYSKNKKAVQQTKQLLFDCVREVVERHKKESPSQHVPQILGPEKLWELICEYIWLWSKESINETNTTHLLHLDVLASAQDLSNFELHKQDIGMQIADAILEDISDEIITDMISSVLHESL